MVGNYVEGCSADVDVEVLAGQDYGEGFPFG